MDAKPFMGATFGMTTTMPGYSLVEDGRTRLSVQDSGGHEVMGAFLNPRTGGEWLLFVTPALASCAGMDFCVGDHLHMFSKKQARYWLGIFAALCDGGMAA